MRKLVTVTFVLFAICIFALAGMAQRPRRRRGRRPPAAAVTIPTSPRIAQELGGLAWGSTHQQVIEYFRQQITARYQPLLRNKGQVEQDRLMQERDREIQQLRDSYVVFNGQTNQRRWDTSFIANEYTHNNGESMLVREEPNGNREFFFFFNDRLWKRYQARAIPTGSQLSWEQFISGVEQIFGPGLHLDRAPEDGGPTVVWQDATTRLHLDNQRTFYNAYGLVYEEQATLSRLAELRRNQPPARTTKTVRRDPNEPVIGNVEGDPNPDIVDRLTGKMRRIQTAPTNGQATGSATSGSTSSSSAPANGTNNNGADDPLRGL